MIGLRGQVAMKSEDVVHEVQFELLDISALAFSNNKLSPRGKEIFD